MSIDLSGMELTRPEREVEIVDKFNEPTGLTFKIRPKTSDHYQKTQRWAQDQFATGKKVPAARRREIGDKLFMARVSGWKWEGAAKKAAGSPDFNPANLKAVLYEQGEHSAAIREQLGTAIGEEEDFLPEE